MIPSSINNKLGNIFFIFPSVFIFLFNIKFIPSNKVNNKIIPPNKFPMDIDPMLFFIAFIPTNNSGVVVNIPNIIPIIYLFIFNFSAIFFTLNIRESADFPKIKNRKNIIKR